MNPRPVHERPRVIVAVVVVQVVRLVAPDVVVASTLGYETIATAAVAESDTHC